MIISALGIFCVLLTFCCSVASETAPGNKSIAERNSNKYAELPQKLVYQKTERKKVNKKCITTKPPIVGLSTTITDFVTFEATAVPDEIMPTAESEEIVATEEMGMEEVTFTEGSTESEEIVTIEETTESEEIVTIEETTEFEEITLTEESSQTQEIFLPEETSAMEEITTPAEISESETISENTEESSEEGVSTSTDNVDSALETPTPESEINFVEESMTEFVEEEYTTESPGSTKPLNVTKLTPTTPKKSNTLPVIGGIG